MVATTDKASESIPISIGYAVRNECSLNTPEAMGKIIILHSPNEYALPVRPGKYRIILGSASDTMYSLSVSCHCAESVAAALKKRTDEAVAKIARRPVCKEELEELHTSIRLAERKYKLVEELVRSAEKTCSSVEATIEELSAKLEATNEADRLAEEEEEEVDGEIARNELLFSVNVRVLMSRRQELQVGWIPMTKCRVRILR